MSGIILGVSSAVIGILYAVVALVSLGIGAGVGYFLYKMLVEKKVGNAKAEAAKILEESKKKFTLHCKKFGLKTNEKLKIQIIAKIKK